MNNESSNKIIKMMNLCEERYSKEMLNHVIRVANTVSKNVCCHHKVEAYLYALAHDLFSIKDSKVTIKQINNIIDGFDYSVINRMNLFTKEENETEEDHIFRILASKDELVYLIKLSELKDNIVYGDSDSVALLLKMI